MIGQRVRRAFQDLVHVRIVEVDALELPLLQACRNGEVREPTRLLTPLEIVRQRLLAIGLESRRPESVADFDVRERYGFQFAVWWVGRPRRRYGKTQSDNNAQYDTTTHVAVPIRACPSHPRLTEIRRRWSAAG